MPPAPDGRRHCGACGITPSITPAVDGMPHGTPAGVACVQLHEQWRCQWFGLPQRPALCRSRAASDMCGAGRAEAMTRLGECERATAAD